MTSKDESILRSTIKQVIYGALERFVSDHVTVELEKNSVRLDRESLLEQSEKIVDQTVNKAIKELKKNGFTSLEDVDDNPEVVDNLLTKLQEEIITNAQPVSKKRH